MNVPLCPLKMAAGIAGYVPPDHAPECIGSACAWWNSQPGVPGHGRCGIGHGNNFRDPAAPVESLARDILAMTEPALDDDSAEPTVDVVDDEEAEAMTPAQRTLLDEELDAIQAEERARPPRRVPQVGEPVEIFANIRRSIIASIVDGTVTDEDGITGTVGALDWSGDRWVEEIPF